MGADPLAEQWNSAVIGGTDSAAAGKERNAVTLDRRASELRLHLRLHFLRRRCLGENREQKKQKLKEKVIYGNNVFVRSTWFR